MQLEILKQIEKKGLRHDWVARKAGISACYLSLILAGKRTPKNKNLITRIKNAVA